MKKALFLLLMLLPSLSVADYCSTQRTVPNPMVILVAGQSNCHYLDSGTTFSSSTAVTINRNYLSQTNFDCPVATSAIDHSAAMLSLGKKLNDFFGVPVKFVMVSIGATSSAQWAGGNESYWIRIATNSAAFNPNLILWVQGEQDVALAVTQNTYYTNFSSMTTNIRNAGVTAPLFCAINSSGSTSVAGYENVRKAQYQAIEAGLALYGPDTDTIRQVSTWVDGTKVHFVGYGFESHADKWFRTIKNYYGY